ncbi:MAG: NADH-ubiquinone oxidoreductase-F iron-sulfur binding region domain-containing protein [Nitrospiraceae bacterium]
MPHRIGSGGREILERIRDGAGTSDDMVLLDDLGRTMKVAKPWCSLGGRAPYPVLTAIEHFPEEFRRRLKHRT